MDQAATKTERTRTEMNRTISASTEALYIRSAIYWVPNMRRFDGSAHIKLWRTGRIELSLHAYEDDRVPNPDAVYPLL